MHKKWLIILFMKHVCHVILLVTFYCLSKCVILLDLFHDAKAKQFIKNLHVIFCEGNLHAVIRCVNRYLYFIATLKSMYRVSLMQWIQYIHNINAIFIIF